MKKTIQLIAMATLCLFLSSVAYAQTVALKIGDKVPDVTIGNISNYKSTSAKLSDFKGKLLILDFWATWCSPCIAMIPKMDSLEKSFKGEVAFMSVTYQDEKVVKPFMESLEKRKGTKFNLPGVIGDRLLQSMFPHTNLPHYVWIDPAGKVLAFTGFEKINGENIGKALNNEISITAQKNEIRVPYDKEKPLFVSGNGGEWPSDPYFKIFSGYRDGLLPGMSVQKRGLEKGFRVMIRNCSIFWFYSLAYSGITDYYGPKRTVYEVADRSPFVLTEIHKNDRDSLASWMKKNLYCYELSLPPRLAQQGFEIMQQDLQRLFPKLKGQLEIRKLKCLVLSRVGNVSKLGTSGLKPSSTFSAVHVKLQNVPLSVMFRRLDKFYLQKHPLPMLDESGLDGPVDLEINGSLSNVGAINSELEKYGLRFIEAERNVSMLVIRDKN